MIQARVTFLVGALIGSVCVSVVFAFLWFHQIHPSSVINPGTSELAPLPLPLLKYQIPALHQNQYNPSQIELLSVVKVEPTFASFLYSYQTVGKKMTGLLNIPLNSAVSKDQNQKLPIIMMVRGYIDPATYHPGDGTKNSAEYFASHGYVTIAPDFFGFGGSDPESPDVWEARFQKPINVAELIKTAQSQTAITIPSEIQKQNPKLPKQLLLDHQKIGMWAHSNGGQIALTTLEILNQPLPTTLWAPVTAPFPYSVLFFSDEESDEGKSSRKWISQFDQQYDALQFSLSQHLDLLTGPLQLHQGLVDEAIHFTWSDEFVVKIKHENSLRASAATESANQNLKSPINITYFRYPNSNHNFTQDWSTLVKRDLDFFGRLVKNQSKN